MGPEAPGAGTVVDAVLLWRHDAVRGEDCGGLRDTRGSFVPQLGARRSPFEGSTGGDNSALVEGMFASEKGAQPRFSSMLRSVECERTHGTSSAETETGKVEVDRLRAAPVRHTCFHVSGARLRFTGPGVRGLRTWRPRRSSQSDV